MKAVVQRVLSGRVVVGGEVVGSVGVGLVVLAAVEVGDGEVEVECMAGKLAGLRVFRGEDGVKHFDRDVGQVGGGILLVSNFTVAAETGKGRRPSLSGAVPPEEGRRVFEMLVEAVKREGVRVETGVFGADMVVQMENDGPATFIVETVTRTTTTKHEDTKGTKTHEEF